MTKGGQFVTATVAALMAFAGMAGKAGAAQCGNGPGGFRGVEQQFADEARARGISPSTVAALLATNYSTATIDADRGQHGFIRRSTISRKARRLGHCCARARAQAIQWDFFASIQQLFGVPPGPLIAIWCMETGFGSFSGSHNTLSPVDDSPMIAAGQPISPTALRGLTLIDRGSLPATRGSMHGEVGQTQFLPKTS